MDIETLFSTFSNIINEPLLLAIVLAVAAIAMFIGVRWRTHRSERRYSERLRSREHIRIEPPVVGPQSPGVSTFKVIRRRVVAPPVQETIDTIRNRLTADWGPVIPRPDTVPVNHNQQRCSICKKTIHEGYLNQGWVRCSTTGYLIHGQCYEACENEFRGCTGGVTREKSAN